jgi:hypothetical protein
MITLFGVLLVVAGVQDLEPAALKGLIGSPWGEPLPQASIRVLQAESNLLVARATSDKTGAFEVHGLRPGSYTLTAWLGGFRLRVWSDVVVREDETKDLGELQLDGSGCDSPGTICETFSSVPVIPGLIRSGELTLGLHCGADLVAGMSRCPANTKADLTVTTEGGRIYLQPLNGARMYAPGYPFDRCKDGIRSDARVRIDGFGHGLDVCVRTRDHRVSHVYVLGEVGADSTEVRIWLTTTKR